MKCGLAGFFDGARCGVYSLLVMMAFFNAELSADVAVGVPPAALAKDAGISRDERKLLQAATIGKAADVRLLLGQGVNPDAIAQDRNRRSALILAAAGGHTEVVEELLLAGADVNYKDNNGLAALNWATLRGRNHLAGLLLRLGADVNTRDNSGVTPLLYAVGTQNLELLDLFVATGAELEVESQVNKMTPLLLAVENGNTEMLITLLDYGARVNGANHEGYSPLMAAVESGQIQAVSILLARGADPSARDSRGRSALRLARKERNAGLIEILENALINPARAN